MNDSILLITSQDAKNKSMGTGFVVHQDEFGSYVVTCAHVIEQVANPKILNYEIVVKAIGTSDTVDLALLYVPKLYREPLKLQVKKSKTIDVYLRGYSLFNKVKYQEKKREATILSTVNLETRKDNKVYKAWQIIAKDHNEIESGNSGGPLICNDSSKVIGVVSNNKGVKQGYAVAIEHLLDIWLEDVPLLLIENKDNEESPFVGLSAFGIRESHLFFGRNQTIQEVLGKLQKSNLVAVVGESGSGKSSLIKAGVIPKYLNGALKVEEDETFHFLTIRPAENIFMEFADTIGKISKCLKLDFKAINEIQKVIEQRDIFSILNACRHLFLEDRKTTLLIYIDQFEELFTSGMEKHRNEDAFIELLLYFLEHQNINSHFTVKIIFSIRVDYYDLIIDHKPFFNEVKDNRYDLKKMTEDEIKECIEKPLERTYIDESEIIPFTNAVIKDMDDNPHELTLLQIALNETWQNRSAYNNNLLQTYHEIGEVSGALSTLAEKTWTSLEASEKKILQYVFIRITKPSDIGGATKRSAKRNEFSEDAWKLAKKLTLSLDSRGNSSNSKSAELGRLLKIRSYQESEVLELMHEILARKWSRYRRWLITVNRNSLRKIHDGVIVKSHHYFNGKKDKKFLLTGYELEESLKLISGEYKKYLSTNEIEFIEKSVWNRKKNIFLKRGLVVVFMSLFGITIFFYNQLKVLSGKHTYFLIKTTESTVSFLEVKGKLKYRTIKNNFDAIVNEFEKSSNLIEQQLVVKAKFGQAILSKELGKNEEALHMYTKLINSEWNNPESEEFVVKSLYNKGRLLQYLSKVEGANSIYNRLIENFKNSSNPIVLELVAKGWYNKVLLNKSKSMALELIKHFLVKKITRSIEREVSKAYAYRAWLYLLEKKYIEAKESASDGLKKFPNNDDLGLNLAHAYLLLGNVDNARKTYEKYQVTKKELKDDFEDFKKVEITNRYFNQKDFLLNNKQRIENDK